MAQSKQHQFSTLSMEDIEKKKLELQNQNTLFNENKVVNAFKLYLSEIGVENTGFFSYTEAELDRYLKLLWFNAKKQNGEDYSAASIETMR